MNGYAVQGDVLEPGEGGCLAPRGHYGAAPAPPQLQLQPSAAMNGLGSNASSGGSMSASGSASGWPVMDQQWSFSPTSAMPVIGVGGVGYSPQRSFAPPAMQHQQQLQQYQQQQQQHQEPTKQQSLRRSNSKCDKALLSGFQGLTSNQQKRHILWVSWRAWCSSTLTARGMEKVLRFVANAWRPYSRTQCGLPASVLFNAWARVVAREVGMRAHKS
mmetsp:Transcript_80579/g.167957  ORF Transcript_80579/g.167957 Transcript_80579/m.167957 type:complete len:216 (-) Transcript_80579:2-649(-)